MRNNFQLFLQVQCNVNKMFQIKKQQEIKDSKHIQKELSKKDTKGDIDIEIIKDKISIFNELDH